MYAITTYRGHSFKLAEEYAVTEFLNDRLVEVELLGEQAIADCLEPFFELGDLSVYEEIYVVNEVVVEGLLR